MNKLFFARTLPLLLLSSLLFILLISVFVSANDYGRTADEAPQDAIGHQVLSWYKTFGRDRTFLSYAPDKFVPQHGIIFDVVVAEAQNVFGNPWHTRSIMTALAGVCGVVAIALCGYELVQSPLNRATQERELQRPSFLFIVLAPAQKFRDKAPGGYWLALLAALGLCLYPRFYGAIFNNPKDIPFASASTFVLWSVLRLIKYWDRRRFFISRSLVVAFCIGLATAIRVNAVTWYPTLVIMLFAWWLFNGRHAWREHELLSALLKQGLSAVIIGLGSLLTMMALWPYIFLNPLANLYDSIQVMQKYPWDGTIFFEGHIYQAAAEPRSYAPIWLFIVSPPQLLILAALGLLIVCSMMLKKRTLEPAISVVGLALSFPLALIVGLHSTLYDGPRQILFLVPPLVLLAAYGLYHSYSFLIKKKQHIIAVSLLVLTLSSYGFVLKDMLLLHPYEYVYFSPLVGGVNGASGNYDMDYWGICNKPAAEWLGSHYKNYTHNPDPSWLGYLFQFQSAIYLPPVFVDGSKQTEPDFFISTTRFGRDKLFPNYRIIHTESVQGTVVCVVKARP